MSWFEKLLPPKIKQIDPAQRKSIPEGLWLKCTACEAVLYRSDLESHLRVCPKCSHHMPIGARERLNSLLDEEGRYEVGQDILPVDALKFKDSRRYVDRLKQATEESQESDALVVIGGSLLGLEVVVACFEFSFMGGSMGSVVGERFIRAARLALEKRIPLICIAASGGARMQENLFSLFQMAKTTAILVELSEARLPFITVLTHPTMGGVSASFAFLGDLVIAEPKALIGFAGPRVIEQTVREKLPEGFQRSEFLKEKGMVDMIVDRRELKQVLAKTIALLTNQLPSTVS